MGARHGTRAPFYQPKALNVQLRKSCASPLLILRQGETGVPPARHPLTQGKGSSYLLRVGLEMVFWAETLTLCIGQ